MNDSRTSVRVGLLCINDPRRGLWRDAEAVLWALEGEPPRFRGARPASVSLFAIPNYGVIARKPAMTRAVAPRVPCPAAVPAGTQFSEWVRTLDVLVTWEKMLAQTFAYVRDKGVRLVYIPHLEWCELGGSVSRWLSAIRAAGCQVWAKTEQVAATLRAVDVACELVPWSIPDPVARQRCRHAEERVTFLINAGMGGWRNRRGVDLALQAYGLALEEAGNINLILKSVKPLQRYVPEELLSLPRIEKIEGLARRDELAALQERADAVLYPSRWEGFGLSLLEALHAGLPVLASDGWPMNELVEHEHNGLLAQAKYAGKVRLAPHWECDPQALAACMVAFARDAALRRRLTCPEPAELVARQYHFRLRVRQLLLEEPAPRAVLYRNGSELGWRRSEEYWADALRRHGYTVEVASYEASAGQLQQQLDEEHDFVLVGKAPVAFLKQVRRMTTRPVILWHHDFCGTRRRWMEEVSQLVDLLCVPESGLEERIPGLQAPVLTLMPGAKVDGDRGPGRRPRRLPPAGRGADVVFLGNNLTRAGNRTRVLRRLARRFDVHVYGRGWGRSRWKAHRPVWSEEAVTANRRARVVLSISATATVPHYTSNRLFNSCGAGACVVAEAYPGLDEHYPRAAVARFHDAAGCVELVARLLADKQQQQRMRVLAEEYTWRHHTWNDRVGTLLERIRTLPGGRATKKETVAMWEARASRLGARAVGYYRWDEAQFARESDAAWEALYPQVQRHEVRPGAAILDFGCGAGRFATRLAEAGYCVAGADITPGLLQLAPAPDGTRLAYVQVAPGEPLPFPAGTFDVLWVVTVLQHVGDAFFPAVVRDVTRVLRPNGLVVLCENTEGRNGRQSATGHVTFRQPCEYEAAFPGISAVDIFSIAGEQHTIFAGWLDGTR